jgi:hypothetical protein
MVRPSHTYQLPWRWAALLLGPALLVPPARAQQPEPPLDGPHHVLKDSLLDHLTGTWSMVGAVRGSPVTYSLRAEWTLNHQFLKLEMRDVAEPPAYQATVFIGYDNTSERYVAHWLDVFGGRFSETLGFGQRDERTIRLVFEYPDGPFHTTFRLEPGGRRWTVLMQDRSPTGAWREFAHYTVDRQ